MKFQDYWQIFRSHRFSVFGIALLGALVSGYLAHTTVPQYRATASVYFSLPASSSATDLNQGATFTQAQVLSYARLATKQIVLDRVIDELDLDLTPRQLARSISASASSNTVIVDVSAVSAKPATAAAVANSTAEQLGVVVRTLAPNDAQGRPAINAAIVAEATPPNFPFTPNTKRDVAIGLVGGLLLGYALALARELLNTKPRDADEIAELTGAPILTQVAQDREISEQTRAPGGSTSTTNEAFRRLRTNLRYVGAERPNNVITVTSSIPGEGKSTVALNFALACAEAGDRVLLIDADLRKPAIARYLDIDRRRGLTNFLGDRQPLDELVQEIQQVGPLDVLASGDIPPNPSQLIDSAPMTQLIAFARMQYDVVIIDSPPLVPVSDGAILARRSDAAVLVANLRLVHRAQLTESAGYLRQVGGELVGVVVNGAVLGEESEYYGYATRPSRWDRLRDALRPRWRRADRNRRPADPTLPIPEPAQRDTRRANLDPPRTGPRR